MGDRIEQATANPGEERDVSPPILSRSLEALIRKIVREELAGLLNGE